MNVFVMLEKWRMKNPEGRHWSIFPVSAEIVQVNVNDLTMKMSGKTRFTTEQILRSNVDIIEEELKPVLAAFD